MNNIADQFLKILNEAFEADPETIGLLICARVYCNEKLANHQTIQVQENKIPSFEGIVYSVGALGIINGILESITKERIAAIFSEPNENGAVKLLGFKRYDS